MNTVTKTSSVMGEATGKVVCAASIPSRSGYMNNDINAAVAVKSPLLHGFTLASLIRSRTHAAPPSALHFSHSASVMRRGRDFMSSPVGLAGLRPCPRSFGGFVVISGLYT